MNAMNEAQGDQASRTRAMYSALIGSGQIPGPVSPGSVPSHLLPQYSTNLHANPYLAAYYSQFASNPPNFVVPSSPAAPGPYFGYTHHSILSASLANHSQSLHPSLVPHSPTSPSDPNKAASSHAIHPRSPSSPKDLPRSETNSAFTSNGKRKAEAGFNPGSTSIMRNRLTRPRHIAILDHRDSFREQEPLSAPPTQTEFAENPMQHWMGHRKVTREPAPSAAPFSAPPIPDDERGEFHFNYPRFSSSFARSSDENIAQQSRGGRDFTGAVARTVRKTSSLESESMDGMAKSDQGSPSTTASMTPPTMAAAINGAQLQSSRGLTCYRKGSVVQLADNSLKKIEDMMTQDFISCVASTPDLVLDSSTIIEIEMKNSLSAHIKFSVGKRGAISKVEVPLEHPFFVYQQGWSSCSPDRSQKVHQLETRLLSVGDNCITLTRRVREPSVNKARPYSRESMPAHRANTNDHNFHAANYSSGSDQHLDEDDDSSVPMNLKKNKSSEMDVDENQNSMKQSSLLEHVRSITTQ